MPPATTNNNLDFERELASIKKQLAQCRKYGIQHDLHPFVRVRAPRSNKKNNKVQVNQPAEHD